jgi:hypothetical protein
MNNTQHIDALWQQFRRAINKTYAAVQEHPYPINDDAQCLRDYAENISWSDDLAALLGRETANERQHRRNRPAIKGFSSETAAKCILMNNALKGAQMPALPSATAFLVLRQTAVEAEVIGFLVKYHLHDAWREAVNMLDYSELMKTA